MGNVLNKNLKGKNYYEIESGLLRELHEDYHERIDDYQYSSIDELMATLAKSLTDSSLTAVKQGLASKEDEKQHGFGLLDQYDVACLAAYIDFARAHRVLNDAQKITIEIREEDTKMYILLPLSASLIHSVALSKPTRKQQGEGAIPSSEGLLVSQDKRANYLWVHSEDWANERFLNKATGPYLCGQKMGMSKFVSLSSSVPTTKEEALVALGLKGYPAFDVKGQALYVIQAAVTDEVLATSQPMIPLIYKAKKELAPSAAVAAGAAKPTVDEKNDGEKKEPAVAETTSYEWVLPDNFGANTIPGFTSGGKSEVVIHTFEVEAKDLDDLRNKGVSVARLMDAASTHAASAAPSSLAPAASPASS